MKAQERQAELIASLLFQVKALGLPEPILEYKFHPERRWRADLAWTLPGYRLLLEIQGGVYSSGRHVRGAGYENDCERMAEAVCLGWRVLWVTPRMIEDGRAVAWLERLLNVRR